MGSFGTLTYFQSEDSALGNSINIAGRNRYLTGNALFEAEKYLQSLSTTDLSKLRAAMENLEPNISVLKQGGKNITYRVRIIIIRVFKLYFHFPPWEKVCSLKIRNRLTQLLHYRFLLPSPARSTSYIPRCLRRVLSFLGIIHWLVALKLSHNNSDR